MQITVYKPQLYLFAFIVLLLASCSNNNQQLTTNQELTPAIESSIKTIGIPDLVQRSKKIQYEKEWDYIQNAFARNKQRIKSTPKDIDAYINLANIYVNEARITGEHGFYYPAALNMVNTAIENKNISKDKMFLALNVKAAVQLSLHEFTDALATAKEALHLNNRNAQIFGVLTDCYVELGDYTKAIEMADKMISIKPDLRSYARISYLREIHGDISGAIDAMEMAAKAGAPNSEETAWTLLTLAELQQKYGNQKEAKHIINQTLELRKDYPFAIAAIGDIYLEEKEYQKAEAKFKEAINIIPEVGFYISLAELYQTQNKTRAFKTTIDEIFDMLQDDVTHGHNMNLEYASLYLYLLNDVKNAEKYVNMEYDKRPNNIEVNFLKAEIAYAKNDITTAKKHSQLAAQTNSKNPALLKFLAKI